MRIPELAAFEDEAHAVEETLATVPDDAWDRPALGDWSVAELVAHMVGTVTRLGTYLDTDAEAAAAVVDRVDYYRDDTDATAPSIAEAARSHAATLDATELPAQFTRAWEVAAARAGGLGGDHLLATWRGVMRLDEYLATRVLELVVHHMDLRAALELPPAATPEAERLAMTLLESLLGSSRPRNFGRDRFIRAATGRLEVDDPRFPVLR